MAANQGFHRLRSRPSTLQPEPLNPAPYTLHPEPLNPKATPYTLNPYRGTSLIRNTPLLGAYSRHMPRALWWSQGGRRVLVRATELADQVAVPLLESERGEIGPIDFKLRIE